MNTPDFSKPVDIKAFLMTHWGLCGCSELEPIIKTLRDFLAWHNASPFARPSFDTLFNGDVGVFYILAGILDEVGISEHGISIRHPWLTDLGKALLDGLIQCSIEEIENPQGEAYDGTSMPTGGY